MGLSGADTLDGGEGDRDRLDFRRDASYGGSLGVLVDLAAGTARDGFGFTDTISGFERVRGTSSADSILGDLNDNLLKGWAEPTSSRGVPEMTASTGGAGPTPTTADQGSTESNTTGTRTPSACAASS